MHGTRLLDPHRASAARRIIVGGVKVVYEERGVGEGGDYVEGMMFVANEKRCNVELILRSPFHLPGLPSLMTYLGKEGSQGGDACLEVVSEKVLLVLASSCLACKQPRGPRPGFVRHQGQDLNKSFAINNVRHDPPY